MDGASEDFSIPYRPMGALHFGGCYYSSPAPSGRECFVISLFILLGTHGGYLPSNTQRNGRADRLDLTIY